MNIRKHITFLVISLITISLYGQPGGSHEIGIYIGAPSFQTDYGQRNNFMSNVGGNVGYGFGIIHYYQFTNYKYNWYERSTFFNEHFKLRTELSYAFSNLNHFGKWVDKPNPYGDETQRDQIRAMTGTAKVYTLGTQLEFYYKDVVDFGLRYYNMFWNPYGGLGLQLNYSKPTYTFDPSRAWGPTPPTEIYYRWREPGDINVESRITGAVSLNIGSRFAITEYSDLFLDVRWSYFMTNYVDGIHAHDKYDKYNDWLTLLQFGYIFYLE